MLPQKQKQFCLLLFMFSALCVGASPVRIQLFGLHNSGEQEQACSFALGVVGSYIPNSCGIQLSTGYAINSTTDGIQAGGVSSICKKLFGTQLSIGLNISGENQGIQIAGVFNHSETLQGMQVGICNSANRGDGLQLGFFNISNSPDVRSIGVINIRRQGLLRWLTAVNSSGELFTGLQSGGMKFYTLVGLEMESLGSLFAVGRRFRGGCLFAEIETGLFLEAGEQDYPQISPLLKLRPGLSLGRAFELFTGVEIRLHDGWRARASASLGMSLGR